jgi:hypothetical protein
MPLVSAKTIFRGSTALFVTTFNDIFGVPVDPQPTAAFVEINYPGLSNNRLTVEVPMIPGDVRTPWMAYWDSRGSGVGTVWWSIHTPTPIPCAVDDGSFQLSANPANLVTFA